MNCTQCENERATSSRGTTISSGSIGDLSQPTKPKPHTAATRLVTIGVTTPTTLRMYSTSDSTRAPMVMQAIHNICDSYWYTQPVNAGWPAM